MQITRLTPDGAILRELGERLARVRKQQRLSQATLAREAGIGVATLRRIEDGKDAQLGSWLKILKALEMEAAIEGLLPADFRSPMDEVVRRSKRGGKRSGEAFQWGDQQS